MTQPSPWTIERFPSVPSTMDLARQRARDSAPDGTVIVADEMTQGRGTHGRPWHAPKGGLYLSVILRGVPSPQLLTLALGNAVANALEVAGVDAQLKWVNDVLVHSRKIAGILVEAESLGSRIDFVVAGIGINVNGATDSFPPTLRSQATTLEAELGCDSCIPDLETLVLAEVATAVRRVQEGEAAQVLNAFRRRDFLEGKSVVVEEGPTKVKGIAQGIDDQGRLLVRTAAGTRALATGSVRLEPTSVAGLQRS